MLLISLAVILPKSSFLLTRCLHLAHVQLVLLCSLDLNRPVLEHLMALVFLLLYISRLAGGRFFIKEGMS
jgi:uncharacterized membrane protein